MGHFLTVEFSEFFIYVEFGQIPSLNLWLVLSFFYMSFTEHEFLISTKFTLSILSSMNHAFDVRSKKSLPNPRASRFSYKLSSRSFIGFVLRVGPRSVLSNFHEG